MRLGSGLTPFPLFTLPILAYIHPALRSGCPFQLRKAELHRTMVRACRRINDIEAFQGHIQIDRHALRQAEGTHTARAAEQKTRHPPGRWPMYFSQSAPGIIFAFL